MKILKWILLVAVAIQIVPFGHSHTNPPVKKEPAWNSPQTADLVRRACYDCHSDETRVWWAVKVAPFSWLARSDIDEAKHHFNFSAWNDRLTVAKMRQALAHGMPPWQYTLVHSEARLSEAQKQELLQGFQASLDAHAGPPPPNP